jgi:predicted ABC-type sugar transport system permease subunit
MNIDSAALTRRARSFQLSNLSRSVPAWITLALLLAWGGLAIPSFLLPDRLLLLGQQVAPLALVAVGETIVLLIGGLDLSVGSVLTLSLVLGAGLAHGSEGAVPFVLVACLGSGLVIGVINGLLIVASDASNYLTGQEVIVDGEHTLNVWLAPLDRAFPPLVSAEEETRSLLRDLDLLGIAHDENGVTVE